MPESIWAVFAILILVRGIIRALVRGFPGAAVIPAIAVSVLTGAAAWFWIMPSPPSSFGLPWLPTALAAVWAMGIFAGSIQTTSDGSLSISEKLGLIVVLVVTLILVVLAGYIAPRPTTAL